jgi:5-methylcytosine-specific restriction protein B
VALLKTRTRDNIQAAVDRWRENCLLKEGSLLYDDQDVWTADNLVRLYQNVIEAPLEDERTFLEKFKVQLKDERELVFLGAEATTIYYLFVWRGGVGPGTKRARVNEILSWVNESLPEDGIVWRALGDDGIGHPGQFYLFRPDAQLGFLADFARRLKSEAPEARREILGDAWRLRDFMDAGVEETIPGMRHILLHLLHPESFERIASGPHKQSIASTYGGFVSDGAIDDVDEQLLAIRRRLEELLDKPSNQLDFYEPPLAGTWGSGLDSDGTDPAEALELKKQLVFFGPPGTSKTYEAKQLAEKIIRRQALRKWGPVAYFEKQQRIEEVLESHIRRLQLHPAYSYEEFIRGLRLRGGQTSYEDGYLLRLIKEIERESVPEGEEQLPWVLIVDELNRADLSRVFGEAFSVLEDRNSPVELPGTEPDKPFAVIRLPDHLYVIGTMNLIDQSLEQIDFALRRRFLWQRSGFDRQRLAEVLPELWAETGPNSSYRWNRIADEMELFIARAELLNEQIATSALLGRDYEVGHTYFFDVIELLARAEHLHRKTRASRFLWNKKGEALQPARDLWRMSLEPLLDQYLQGVDAEARRTELERLAKVFLKGQTA